MVDNSINSGIDAINSVPPSVAFPRPFVLQGGPVFSNEPQFVPQVFTQQIVNQLLTHSWPSGIFTFIPAEAFLIPGVQLAKAQHVDQLEDHAIPGTAAFSFIPPHSFLITAPPKNS